VTSSEILRCLPASLEWMVMFRLSAIRPFAGDSTIRAMYFLPPSVDFESYSHVVLTAAGRFLAPFEGELLLLIQDNRVLPFPKPEASLFDRHEDRFRMFPSDTADCLGLGAKSPPQPAVLLHLELKDGWGHASALFRREPSRTHYPLLKAVGVEYLGGFALDGGFMASFRNRLPTHIHAATLGGFARTHHCNEFFFRHGDIDAELENGLLQAAGDRVSSGARSALAGCVCLAARACSESLPMDCCPPPPEKPRPYGDLVPLGFLLRALNQGKGDAAAGAACEVRSKLLAAREGDLWAFHTGRLVTSTDSALILQGFNDPSAVAALEQFSDGSGAYFPQLASAKPHPGKMLSVPANRHWCQPDFATTCLVRALRARAGLDPLTPSALIEVWLDRRAGLYFANPYLVDWAVAEAIHKDADTDLKRLLSDEILASGNPDFSFGHYDVALSTAFAILALDMLGHRSRSLRLAQLRLLDWMDEDGCWPESTPFYSTFVCDHSTVGPLPPQFVRVNGDIHELSLYRDTHRMIGTSVAALALAVDCSVESPDGPTPDQPHPRYCCRSHSEYVQQVALAPYVRRAEAA
jgi:hypothetical protein